MEALAAGIDLFDVVDHFRACHDLADGGAAFQEGLSLARLETGVFQPEALGLYEKAGYQRRGPFGLFQTRGERAAHVGRALAFARDVLTREQQFCALAGITHADPHAGLRRTRFVISQSRKDPNVVPVGLPVRRCLGDKIEVGPSIVADEKAESAGIVTSSKIGHSRLIRANTHSPYFDGLADILIIAISPLFTSDIVRNYAWLVVLGKNGLVNTTLMTVGIIDQPLAILYTPLAVIIALIVIVIDELADLMMVTGKKIEELIARIRELQEDGGTPDATPH